MPEAVRLYEDLVRRGHGAAEVHFNLGNAHAGEGRIGDAVLSYRRAWRLAPRDPDADANLRVALQATGAAEPDFSGLEIVFTGASAREWGAVALASWWALWTLLVLAALLRGARWWLVRGAPSPGSRWSRGSSASGRGGGSTATPRWSCCATPRTRCARPRRRQHRTLRCLKVRWSAPGSPG